MYVGVHSGLINAIEPLLWILAPVMPVRHTYYNGTRRSHDYYALGELFVEGCRYSPGVGMCVRTPRSTLCSTLSLLLSVLTGVQ